MDSPEALLCSVLRREAPAWPGPPDVISPARLFDVARYHGVVPLVHAELRSGRDYSTWPKEALGAFRNATLSHGVYETIRHAEIGRVLQALSSSGVRPLLLKGMPLAHSHYPDPLLRPRCDTDFLIPQRQLSQTYRTLEELGYAKREGVAGNFVSHQTCWRRTDQTRATHDLDVHWRINNSQMLAGLLDYEELAARATALPALGAAATTLADVDALLLACIHRAGHVTYEDRLIWLYDIHLLASGLAAADFDEFAALATAKKIRFICLDGLAHARDRFGTAIPPSVVATLSRPGPVELSARYLSGGPVRQMVGDFLALDSWLDRVGMMKEMAFPSAHYMRSKYPRATISWLPFLYARRAIAGLARLWQIDRSGPQTDGSPAHRPK